MNIKSILKLDERESKLLVRISVFSGLGCIVVVALTWAFQFAVVQVQVATAQKKKEAISLESLYEKKSVDLMTVDIEAHRLASQSFLARNEPQKAINHILRILPLYKNDDELSFQLATAYLETGMYEKAILLLGTMANEPETADTLLPEIRARYGLALFYAGKIRESIAALSSAMSEYPSAEAACYLGQVAAAVDSGSDRADTYFQKAIELDSLYAEAWYQKARFAMHRNRYNDARRYLLKALRIEPLHAKSHARLGMVYYYLNHHHLAESAYQTALRLNKDDINTHYNYGELLFSVYGRNKEALKEFAETLKRDPAHIQANFKSGIICAGNGMYKEAAVFFERARKLDPHNIRILLQLAASYEKLDNADAARGAYQDVLKIKPLHDVALQKIKLLSSKG